MKRDTLIFERANCFRMDNLGTTVCEFDGIIVGEFGQENGIFDQSRVGIEDTLHIFPYRDTLSIEDVSQNGSGIITPLSSERGMQSFCRTSDEALRDIVS